MPASSPGRPGHPRVSPARPSSRTTDKPNGGKVKLTLGVTLSRAQADRLTARAIAEGKNLDALVAEILEAAPTEPTA